MVCCSLLLLAAAAATGMAGLVIVASSSLAHASNGAAPDRHHAGRFFNFRPHYCLAVSPLPYLRRDDLDPDGQQVWDSVVGSRGDLLVNEQGGLAGPFNAFVHAPDVGRHLASLGRDTGWNVGRIARAWDELMQRLGYPRYGAQGGDWGASISRGLGVLVPEHLAGVHLNMLYTRVPPDAGELTEVEQERAAAAERFRATGSGYGVIQSTRPQTIAYGLTDSPVGQLAWIAEKFGEWTDNGLPDEAVDRDQLLANVSLYWLTATAGSSARLYYEAVRSGSRGQPTPSTAPPAWPSSPGRSHRPSAVSPS
jgi:hypothetical protein